MNILPQSIFVITSLVNNASIITQYVSAP